MSFAGAFVVDLVVADGRCRGVVAELAPGDPLTVLLAPVTVLAAGGAGHLWATTSNPRGATADGLAMALRAGATVADTEFVQFHPTVLALPGETPFLVSEAVRGEGAFLRGAAGERFMLDIHPLAELAPRDVVARAIQRADGAVTSAITSISISGTSTGGYARPIPDDHERTGARGLDLATDLIPVTPAAHYFIGGVAATPEGLTSLPGLLALGEAAATGIHGANRLASNSLLEGLVFGMAGADRLAREWPHVALKLIPGASLDRWPSAGISSRRRSIRLRRGCSGHEPRRRCRARCGRAGRPRKRISKPSPRCSSDNPAGPSARATHGRLGAAEPDRRRHGR